MKNNKLIVFELPTNPLSKISLYLESLIHIVMDSTHESHPYIHHYAVDNILEIIKVIEKPEIKSRFLKEFIRIAHYIEKAEFEGGEIWLKDINHQIHQIAQASGRFGEELTHDLFLQSIKPIQSSLSSECELQSPKLAFWLQQPAELRQHDLSRWFLSLKLLYESISLYLNLLRSALSFEEVDTRVGFYQRSIPSKNACQLIQVQIPAQYGIIPRMNLGQHGFSMRLDPFDKTKISDFDHKSLVCKLGFSLI